LGVTAKEFQKLVTEDKSDFLDRFLALLAQLKIDYCVIGGLAVNAYAEPLVTLDCDVIVVASRIEELEKELRARFDVERFPHSLNVADKGSRVRVQIQTDPRYQSFLSRSTTREVLERQLRVAALEDLLQGKVWAYEDATRRGSKRQKDLLDIARLLETHPAVAGKVPDDIRRKLL
jgi:hypothetical protein